MLGKKRSSQLNYFYRDTWKACLNVIAVRDSQAIYILDRFLIVAHLNKAIDQVGAVEARLMK